MKKTLAVILALAVLCIMAVGGTMSYLTYTDYDVNTMTVGNVTITQNEQQRDGTDFVDRPLLPVTADPVDVNINDSTFSMVPQDKNGVDKIVTITNAPNSQSAYIRTLIAFELKNDTTNPIGTDLTVVTNDTVGTFASTGFIIEIASTKYIVYSFTYNNALEKNATSAPSLVQIYLNKTVDHEFYDAVGEEYKILTLSQAVQAAGFDGATAAFNAAFELTQDNVQTWFAAINP